MKVRDVMTPNVVSVAADMAVPEIAKLMLERRISAVPVIDAKAQVVGVISEGDLIRRPEIGTDKPRSRWLSSVTRPGSPSCAGRWTGRWSTRWRTWDPSRGPRP